MAFVNPFLVDKTVNSTVNNNITFDTDITFDKDFNADIDIDAFADIDGNISTLTLDAEAIGTDTLVEVDSSVLSIHGELSSVSLSVISAVAPKATVKEAEDGNLNVVGNTESFNIGDTNTDFTIEIIDIDDLNPFGGLVGRLDDTGGVNDVGVPSPGDPFNFDPFTTTLNLDAEGMTLTSPGGNFNYTLDGEATFTFGLLIDTMVFEIAGDTTSDMIDVSGEEFKLVVPDGAIFNVSINPDGSKDVELINLGDDPRTMPDESVILMIGVGGGSLTYSLDSKNLTFTDATGVGEDSWTILADLPDIFVV